MWAQGLLEISPERELQIACCAKLPSDERRAAWQRYEAKKAYELLCGSTVRCDLNEFDPQMASEVAEIRRQAGAKIPWAEAEREFSDTALPVPPLPRSENPLRSYETAKADENGWGPFSGYFDRSCD